MFTADSSFQIIWSVLVTNGPTYLVMITGIILSLQYTQRFPRAARLALIGLSVLLLNSLFGSYLGARLPFILQQQGFGFERMSLIFGLTNFVRSLIAAAGYGFLLAAIFSGRRDEA